MRNLGITLFAVILPTANAASADQRIIEQLKKLDPDTRLEQACDTEAMRRIGADKNGFRPDKVIAYSFGDTKPSGDQITAPGAVFRSRGEWYRLSFVCRTGPQRVDVQAFSYKIGKKVDRDDWQKHYLYD